MSNIIVLYRAYKLERDAIKLLRLNSNDTKVKHRDRSNSALSHDYCQGIGLS